MANRCANCKQETTAKNNCGRCGTYPLCDDCAKPEKHRATGSMWRCKTMTEMKAKQHPVQQVKR